MKKIYLTLFILLLSNVLFAQKDYYWSSGKKHFLDKQTHKFIVKIKTDKTFDTVNKQLKSTGDFKKIYKFKKELNIIQANTDLSTNINKLHQLNTFEKIMPTYKFGNLPFYLTGEILLQPKENISIKDILELINNEAKIVSRSEYNTYVIEPDNWDNLLENSNKIYESGLVHYCHPNFVAPREIHQINDPMYNEQFYLNNTGQFNGTPGIDINVEGAWGITTSCSTVTVAVIDDGVENHDELNGRVLNGFTPQFSAENPDNQGAPNDNDRPVTLFPYDSDGPFGHGQCCAGIIAASHNNLGIRGVAPEINILPVNIFNDWFVDQTVHNGITHDFINYTEDANDLAVAIDFAWNAGGADIISNSWGFNTTDSNNVVDGDAIIAAIQRARNNGAIVVFSSGNYALDFDGVSFPANVDGVITVGAVDNNGTIADYSSRGAEMDFVAPSSGTTNNVRTIDRSDENGYVNGDYFDNFGGTSAACPQVSGVVALMLSVNLNLTETQVRAILQETATDMGPSGFDNTYGYGRLNAHAAVLKASGGNISGPSIVCTSNSTFTLTGVTVGLDINWDCSSSTLLQVEGDTGNSYTVKAQSSSTSGQGWVKATITTACGDVIVKQQNVWVGPPSHLFMNQTFTVGYDAACANNTVGIKIVSSSDLLDNSITRFSWDMGDWSSYFFTHGNVPFNREAYFYLQPNASGKYNVLHVTATNACGDSYPVSRGYYVSDCGGGWYMQTSPNPANEYIEVNFFEGDELSETEKSDRTWIEQDEKHKGSTLSYEVQLWNDQGLLIKQQSDQQKLQLPTAKLKNGHYFLHLIVNGKTYKQQIIVKH